MANNAAIHIRKEVLTVSMIHSLRHCAKAVLHPFVRVGTQDMILKVFQVSKLMKHAKKRIILGHDESTILRAICQLELDF